MTTQHLLARRILLIISGGISAYKSLDLIRRLREQGADVRCILTSGGAEFITPLSVAALSENKVYTDLFSLTDEQEMGHIRLARDCDLVLVVPASASMIARAAQGLADNLASTVLLATDKPVMMAPAMNPAMYQNQATQENIETLKRRGTHILEPATGEMACGEFGAGRLPDVPDIVQAITDFFTKDAPLSGLKALVTSGPTHEPLDPVRFLGNHSSGKQGHAIAAALAQAGAEVTLVTGPVSEADPAHLRTIRVTTAQEMLDACLKSLPVDIAVCAAAVADYRPAEAATNKIKKNNKDGLHLDLVQNPDILHTISNGNSRPKLVIGFAAETDPDHKKAEAKLTRKNCDWLVLNDVSSGQVFGQEKNTVTLLQRSNNTLTGNTTKGNTVTGSSITADAWPEMDKTAVARQLTECIIKFMG